MEKVCIKFIIVLITLTVFLTNDIDFKISEILFSFAVFIFLYNLFFYLGKYLKVRRERQNYDLIVNPLEKYLEWKSTQ